MDDFVQFNLVRIDATTGGKPGPVEVVRERVDLIARQFRDYLRGPADETPHGLMITNEFKVTRHAGPAAGWISFLADVGDGTAEKLVEVAVVAFLREKGTEADAALERLGPGVDLSALPDLPAAIAVRLSKDEPFVVREWYAKAAAGYFAPR